MTSITKKMAEDLVESRSRQHEIVDRCMQTEVDSRHRIFQPAGLHAIGSEETISNSRREPRAGHFLSKYGASQLQRRDRGTSPQFRLGALGRNCPGSRHVGNYCIWTPRCFPHAEQTYDIWRRICQSERDNHQTQSLLQVCKTWAPRTNLSWLRPRPARSLDQPILTGYKNVSPATCLWTARAAGTQLG